MIIKTSCFVFVVFFTLSISSNIFVITTVYSNENKDLSQKNKTPIDHVIIISQGRRSFHNHFGSYEGLMDFLKIQVSQ